MDYFLIYKDKKGKKRAAVPNVEGVYKSDMPFEEYDEELLETEIIITKVYNLDSLIADCDEEEAEQYISFKIVGKFITSEKVYKCIDKIGFEKFFTSIIKRHIETAADIEEE